MTCDDELQIRLNRLGIAPEVAGAALELDATLQRWRRRAMKRNLERRAIADLGLDIDLATLAVLLAIAAPAAEAASEVTVGAVASALGVDPSRASRLVAAAIMHGSARRAVSQDDARRTIVELTPAGHAVVVAVRSYKVMLLADFLSEWTAEEIAAVLPLLERLSLWTDHATSTASRRFAGEAATLIEELEAAGARKEA